MRQIPCQKWLAIRGLWYEVRGTGQGNRQRGAGTRGKSKIVLPDGLHLQLLSVALSLLPAAYLFILAHVSFRLTVLLKTRCSGEES
jgi:hypothetical protein